MSKAMSKMMTGHRTKEMKKGALRIGFNRGKQFLLETVLFLISLIILVPYFVLILNAMKDKAGAAEMNLTFPSEFHFFDNIKTVSETANIFVGYKNSMLVTGSSVLSILLLAAMTAFVLQRKNTKTSKKLFALILLGIVMPVSMPTTYFLLSWMGLTKFIVAPILIYTVALFPLATFLYTGYYNSIPRDVDEAAVIDGCGPYKLFFTVILPLVKPITMTVLIMVAMIIWNDFGIAIYFLSAPEKNTLVMSMLNFVSSTGSDWNLVFTNILLINGPLIILYFFLQKHIVSGLTQGAVKG